MLTWFGLLTSSAGLTGCDVNGVETGLEITWPIADSQRPAALSSTFGPRIQGSTEDYDFHRGIDLPVPTGTQVLAAAAGEVVVAGDSRDYPDDSVQVAHCADDLPPAVIEQCQEPFFTLYSHLSEIAVETGDRLSRGQSLGRSGASSSGFEHLHFEIREGGSWQRYAVHPLAFLPHPDTGPAEVKIDEVIFDDPEAPIVHGVVTRPATELDFVRMDVELYAGNDGLLLSSQSYDLNEWNREHTPDDDPNEKLDNPFFNGVTVRPQPFGMDSDTYEILFRFRRLESDVGKDDLRVVVRTLDIDGQVDVTECHPCEFEE